MGNSVQKEKREVAKFIKLKEVQQPPCGRHALVICIHEYENDRLPGALVDRVRSIHCLSSLGFKVSCPDSARPGLLNLTDLRQAVRIFLNEVSDAVKANGTAVVMVIVSCHATICSSSRGFPLLHVSCGKTFNIHNELMGGLSQIRGKEGQNLKSVLVFDCCRLSQEETGDLQVSSSFWNDLYMLCACPPGRAAYENQEGGEVINAVTGLLPYARPISQILEKAAQICCQRGRVRGMQQKPCLHICSGEHTPVLGSQQGDLPSSHTIVVLGEPVNGQTMTQKVFGRCCRPSCSDIQEPNCIDIAEVPEGRFSCRMVELQDPLVEEEVDQVERQLSHLAPMGVDAFVIANPHVRLGRLARQLCSDSAAFKTPQHVICLLPSQTAAASLPLMMQGVVKVVSGCSMAEGEVQAKIFEELRQLMRLNGGKRYPRNLPILAAPLGNVKLGKPLPVPQPVPRSTEPNPLHETTVAADWSNRVTAEAGVQTEIFEETAKRTMWQWSPAQPVPEPNPIKSTTATSNSSKNMFALVVCPSRYLHHRDLRSPARDKRRSVECLIRLGFDVRCPDEEGFLPLSVLRDATSTFLNDIRTSAQKQKTYVAFVFSSHACADPIDPVFPEILVSDSPSGSESSLDSNYRFAILVAALNGIPNKHGCLEILLIADTCRHSKERGSNVPTWRTRAPVRWGRACNFYGIFSCDPGKVAYDLEKEPTLVDAVMDLLPYALPLTEVLERAALHFQQTCQGQSPWTWCRPSDSIPILGTQLPPAEPEALRQPQHLTGQEADAAPVDLSGIHIIQNIGRWSDLLPTVLPTTSQTVLHRVPDPEKEKEVGSGSIEEETVIFTKVEETGVSGGFQKLVEHVDNPEVRFKARDTGRTGKPTEPIEAIFRQCLEERPRPQDLLKDLELLDQFELATPADPEDPHINTKLLVRRLSLDSETIEKVVGALNKSHVRKAEEISGTSSASPPDTLTTSRSEDIKEEPGVFCKMFDESGCVVCFDERNTGRNDRMTQDGDLMPASVVVQECLEQKPRDEAILEELKFLDKFQLEMPADAADPLCKERLLVRQRSLDHETVIRINAALDKVLLRACGRGRRKPKMSVDGKPADYGNLGPSPPGSPRASGSRPVVLLDELLPDTRR